ncbi:hypothetical protein [Acinetobacter pittii]|uniref:hypothetical protein n=1 Tax=Acinetobacter pittii TaxID=48296 RepID=UPI001E594AAE|nr:hypothetical protein [Acinetobacter pittii]
MASLSTLFASAQKGFLKNVLQGAGITLGTAGISLAIINTMITHFSNSVHQLPVVLLQMAGVTGLDIYFRLYLVQLLPSILDKLLHCIYLRNNNGDKKCYILSLVRLEHLRRPLLLLN